VSSQEDFPALPAASPSRAAARLQSESPALETDAVDLFSYADPTDPKLKRLVIAAIERLTGQPRLKRMYLHYRANPISGESFWEAAVRYLKLHVAYDQERFAKIPTSGPVVFVANHPFGVLDGIVLSYLVSKVRPDFKILTNSVLYRAPEIRPYLLPIDFTETRDAMATNLRSRAEARAILKSGGVIASFPGGTVSTAPKPFGQAIDPDWKPFTARLIMEAKATVIPVHFPGQNSRLFQIASHVSATLRLSLLFKEVARRIGSDMPVVLGEPLPYADLQHITDRRDLADHLRRITYALAHEHPKPAKRFRLPKPRPRRKHAS